MKSVGRKIRSKNGASILFAILIFMLCILAGTAALTAAAANSGRYTHLEAEQQEYLSVSSAVQLLKKEIAGKKFTAGVQQVIDSTAPAGTSSVTPSSPGGDPEMGGAFRGVFMDYFTYLFGKEVKDKLGVWPTLSGAALHTMDALKKTLTFKVDGMYQVTVEITADENFNITAKAYISVDTDGNGSEDYKSNFTTIVFTASPDYKVTSTSRTENVAPGPGGGAVTQKTVTTNVMSLTVTWMEDNVTVYSGEVTS